MYRQKDLELRKRIKEDDFIFRTSNEDPDYQSLYLAEEKRHDAEKIVMEKSISEEDRNNRQTLLDFAKAQNRAADYEIAHGDRNIGKLLIKANLEVIDIALDFTPAGPVKNALSFLTGYNMAGEKLTNVERAIAFGSIFLPGALKLGGIGLAKLGVLIVNGCFDAEYPKYWPIFVGILKNSDKEVSILSKAKRTGYLGEITDDVVDLVQRTIPSARNSPEKLVETISFMKKMIVKGEKGFANQAPGLLERLGEPGLQRFSNTIARLKKSGFKPNTATQEYLAKYIRFEEQILGKGLIQSEENLTRIGISYYNLTKNFKKLRPTEVSTTVWRGVPEKVINAKTGEILFINTEKTVFNFHPGTTWANGRYSMPGDTALYTSMGENTVAWNTVLEELGDVAGQPLILSSMELKLSKVLDLRDSNNLKLLKLDVDQLILPFRNDNAYELTHQIGNIAKKYGYDGIIAPTATGTGGFNLIILKR